MKILVIHGPNLNLLGQRKEGVYGKKTLEEINSLLQQQANELDIEIVKFQSNNEGALIDFIQAESPKAEGIIINPGALTHYSYALRDAINAIDVDTVEVHMSNVYAREDFRHKSVIAPVCLGHVVGFGYYGYAMALSYFADHSERK